jgi:hypothetical protein
MATARDFDRAMERKLGCARTGIRHQTRVFTVNGRHVGYSVRSFAPSSVSIRLVSYLPR